MTKEEFSNIKEGDFLLAEWPKEDGTAVGIALAWIPTTNAYRDKMLAVRWIVKPRNPAHSLCHTLVGTEESYDLNFYDVGDASQAYCSPRTPNKNKLRGESQ